MHSDFFDTIPDLFGELFCDTENIWEALNRLDAYCIHACQNKKTDATYSEKNITIMGDVVIGANVAIEPGVFIRGPVIIGDNCEIRTNARIRDGVVIGNNCIVGHCTEVVRSILFHNVHAEHFNYIGDSILGNNVHLGAGVITANLRFDKKNILVDGIDTGRNKFGVILGDRCEIGANVSIGPGVLFKKDTWMPSKDQLKSGVYDTDILRGKR